MTGQHGVNKWQRTTASINTHTVRYVIELRASGVKAIVVAAILAIYQSGIIQRAKGTHYDW